MVAPMADKLFDIEGAVDMSAQLQVLGGEWSKLADPFHLMYMARNDMEGLTKEVVNATAASAHFSKENKHFEISALEMQSLRKVAEQTGVNYEVLADSAKKAAQFAGIRKQISFDFDKDTKEFIENTASGFDENGNATITIDGKPRLVKELNSMDKTMLESMIAEKKTLKERADAAQTFDDKLNNLINQVKTLLLPVLEGIDTTLSPIVNKFSEAIANPKFLETIKGLGEWIGKFIGNIATFMVENPKWSLALFGVFEAAKWILNGVALGIGFNKTAGLSKGGGAGGGGGFFSMGGASKAGGMSMADRRFAMGQALSKNGPGAGYSRMGMAKTALGSNMGMGARMGLGLGLGGLGMGLDYARGQMDNPETTGGKLLGIGSSAAKYAGMGTMLGGPWGALIGGLIGGGMGVYNENFDKGEKTKSLGYDDAIYFNPKDKFLKLNDGAMIAGTNENGNKDLAQALMSANNIGESKTSNSSPITKIEFGEISINGKLIVETPGSPNMGVDLLKNQTFMTELSQKLLTHIDVMVHQKPKG